MARLSLKEGLYYVIPAFVALCATTSSFADEGKTTAGNGTLVNIQAPSILAPHEMSASIDVRGFGSIDGTTFFSPSIRYGVANNWELSLNTALAQVRNVPVGAKVAKLGGSDLELAAKYTTRQSAGYALAYTVGVSVPNSPGNKTTTLTAGMTGSYNVNNKLTLFLNPRALLIQSQPLVGVGLGGEFTLTPHIGVVADYTAIFAGTNTLDYRTGTARSRDVYGAALRYHAAKNLSVDLGYTNGLGGTTGGSLSHALGYSGAIYAAINIVR